MKITIYELLGLIKDGKAPKRILYKGKVYERGWSDYMGDEPIDDYYVDANSYGWNCASSLTLDTEIEIIDDTPKVTVEMTQEEYFRYLDLKHIGNQPVEDKEYEFIDIDSYIGNVGRVDESNIEEYIHILFNQQSTLIQNQKKIIERLDK